MVLENRDLYEDLNRSMPAAKRLGLGTVIKNLQILSGDFPEVGTITDLLDTVEAQGVTIATQTDAIAAQDTLITELQTQFNSLLTKLDTDFTGNNGAVLNAEFDVNYSSTLAIS